jgi:hypothetical protein
MQGWRCAHRTEESKMKMESAVIVVEPHLH